MKNRYTLSIISILLISIMLCSFFSLSVSAIEEAKSNAIAKIDPVLLEKMESASPDEEHAVWIWYYDVNQSEIDLEVKERTGYDIENISVSMEMPSPSMINGYKNKDASAIKEAEEYFKATKKLRALEQKRTNDFISTRRNISREKYNEVSTKIIEDFSISNDNIIFKSQFAPTVIANLKNDEIFDLAKDNRVEEICIYYELEPIEAAADASVTSAKKTMRMIDDNRDSLLGLTGEGVTIGLADTGEPDDYSELDPNSVFPVGVSIQDSEHASIMANIMIGQDNGFAPNAKLAVTDSWYLNNIELLLYENSEIEALPVKIIDITSVFSRTSDEEYAYSNVDKWFDHIVAHHNVTVISPVGGLDSAGYDYRIFSPAMGYNVIGVGVYEDKGTPYVHTDDVMDSVSRHRNTHPTNTSIVGVEKPDVVMPEVFGYGGTCSASAELTAIIALLYELKPSLAAFPQATKAIVMASCNRKVLPGHGEPRETMVQGITNYQGAGAPDAWNMVCIVCQGTYGTGYISGNRTLGTRRFVMSNYGAENLNVSITWLREVVRDEDSYTGAFDVYDDDDTVEDEGYVDLDLGVTVNGVLQSSNNCNSSNGKISSTEMAYVPLGANNSIYQIRVTKNTTSFTGKVRYGYAYCTDNMYAMPVTDECITYLRNYYNDKYLTLNTTTNATYLDNFTGADNQKWIIKKSTVDGKFEICSAYNSVEGNLNIGSKLGTNPYYTAQLGNNNLGLTLNKWDELNTVSEDGIAFTSSYNGTNYILSYTSSTGIFLQSNSSPVINNYRTWVLEKVHYRRGDADGNGVLNVKDATEIQKYLADLRTFNNIQSFLADADYDGSITIKDPTRIEKILSGNNIY